MYPTLNSNTIAEEIFLIANSDVARFCPDCDTALSYRDNRLRIMRTYGGKVNHVLVRRLYCPRCHRLHTELPVQIVPHKHYSAEVIEDVLDGVVDENSPETEAGPSEMTIKRWHSWFRKNSQRIIGYFRSIVHRSHGLTKEPDGSGESLFEHLRDNGTGWLGITLSILYNTGGTLVPTGS